MKLQYPMLRAVKDTENTKPYPGKDTVWNGFVLRLLVFLLTAAVILTGAVSLADDLSLPESVFIIEDEAFYGLRAENVLLPDGISRIGSRAFANSMLQDINLPASLSYIAPDAFAGCSRVTALVRENSYAHTWCRSNRVPFRLEKEQQAVLPAVQAETPVKTNDSRILIQWSAVEGADGYAVFEQVSGIQILVASTTKTSAYLTGATAGAHTYVIRAWRGGDRTFTSGEASETVSVTLGENEFAAPPVVSSVDETSANSVKLSWKGSAKNYVILEIAEDGRETEIRTTANSTVTLTNVSAGEHCYAIRSVYQDGSTSVSEARSVTVYGAAESVSVAEDHVEIYWNETYELTANVYPKGTVQSRLSWSSSDTSIAYVDERGIITGKKAGTATITVTVQTTSLSASCVITVLDFNSTENGFTIEHGVLTKYTGPGGAVVIPDGVKKIGSDAFYECTALTGITLPESVTEIGDFAFYKCSQLSSIRFSPTLTLIGKYAFGECTSLTNVILPEGIKELRSGSFSGCTSLLGIYLPDSLSTIGGVSFRKCENLSELTIPRGITRVENDLCWECVNLTSVTLPDGLIYIGADAFGLCWKLRFIEIPSTVTMINDGAFDGCGSLTHITIPEGLTRINTNAFTGCSGLTEIRIPGNVRTIGYSAFKGTSISSVTIPAKVTEISDYAFENCSNLRTVTFEGESCSLGKYMFSGCEKLTDIILPKNLISLSESMFSDCDSLTTLSIPDSVVSIGNLAFNYCSGLTRIALPDGLMKIGSGAFGNCVNLQDVVIPGNVSSIGGYAFNGCKKLTSIVIPDRVTELPMSVFEETGLRQVLIPSSVTSISSSAFIYGNKELTIYGEPGSAAQMYADSKHILFRDASSWPGTAAPFVPVSGVDPTGITVLPESALVQAGKTISLTVVPQPVTAQIRPYTYASSDASVAEWDPVHGAVIAKKPGRATITVSSYNQRKATSAITVIPEDYSEQDYHAVLSRIDEEYQWMLFFDTFLRGGGTNPLGIRQPGIDLSSMTNSILQTAYKNIFGSGSGTIEGNMTRAVTIFHSTMNTLSDGGKKFAFYDAAKAVKNLMSKLNLTESAYNAVYKTFVSVWYAGKFDNDDFDMTLLNQWFNDDLKKEIKSLSLANDASKSIMSIFKICTLYMKYSTVNPAEAEKYVKALSESSEAALQYAACLIDDYVHLSESEKIETLSAYIGLLPAAQKVASKLVKKGISAGVTKLAGFFPVLGPVATGISIGVSFGTAANNLILNLDSIQEAAFKAQFAINLAYKYRSNFISAYRSFKVDTLNPQKYETLVLSYLAYKELLGQAYDAFAELPRAIDDSLAAQLAGLISGSNYSEAVSSAKAFGRMARTYMDYDLGVYGDDFFPGTEISSYLIH